MRNSCETVIVLSIPTWPWCDITPAARWHPWCSRSIRGILTNWRAGRWFRSLNWLRQHETCHAIDRSAGQKGPKSTTIHPHFIALFYHCTAQPKPSWGLPCSFKQAHPKQTSFKFWCTNESDFCEVYVCCLFGVNGVVGCRTGGNSCNLSVQSGLVLPPADRSHKQS